MRKLSLAIAVGATAAALAVPALAETVYVYRDTPALVVTEPNLVLPATPGERVYVERPYNAYESYYVWDPATRTYQARYRYRVVDDSGRSYPVTPAESSRLYGYPYGYDGNPGYLYWDGHGVSLAPDKGLTRDSNPENYSSGHYNPKP